MPDDLTELRDPALMELFGRLTEWVNYLAGVLGVAEVDEREAQRSLDGAEAVALLRLKPTGKNGDTLTIARLERDQDPEVIERGEVAEQAHAYRKLLGVLYGNAERDLALVSRELTRRVGGNGTARAERSARWRS